MKAAASGFGGLLDLVPFGERNSFASQRLAGAQPELFRPYQLNGPTTWSEEIVCIFPIESWKSRFVLWPPTCRQLLSRQAVGS
jgi:hypothetical protein